MNESTAKPVPDYFDRAHSGAIDKEVSKVMSQMIIPTKHSGVPAAPSFFLEAKSSKGGADVALRQACLDGAYGARAMHALQSYGETDSAYDGNACTYISTYHNGTLKLYAHHVRAPATSGERPEYDMTQIDTWGMTGNLDTLRRGATAFRNARDLAKRHRNSFIQAANARASRVTSAAQDNVGETNEEEDPDPTAWQYAHDVLQQQIGDTCDDNSQGGTETNAASPCLDIEDNSRNPSQGSTVLDRDNLSMSFASSFTSGCSAGAIRSKPRLAAETGTPPAGLDVSRKNKDYFLDPEGMMPRTVGGLGGVNLALPLATCQFGPGVLSGRVARGGKEKSQETAYSPAT
ncbi:hypothetical protein TOPH_03330 [Tolypocladium ophioglossoides CBS 100239]|uniref:Uncharacterized protein n=1 Tax=Tolypocladium ophioglossoides (strain CBS 100239) TaxID=1163406 RepID=A0A0L0NCJ0_TOLOC|nr:hypothetical protein TOPH_03330 [Tolypocladium ophioglossoides CBS 100239]